MNVIAHYDALIDEGNDPVNDPVSLKEYMDKWDGQVFIDALQLDQSKTVLEIGVGTGRLAVKAAPFCKEFHGIDISPKTIERAFHHLSQYQNANLICADFMDYDFRLSFDVVYSSLTFMHIQNKQACIRKISALLRPNGRLVLSIDKSQNPYIDYGSRKIKLYPDHPADIEAYLANAGLTLLDCIETEFAYIFVGRKLQKSR